MQRKGLVQTGDLEDLDDLVLSHHDREVTASGAHPLEPLHQDTEARGVQEVHLFHVHHEVDGACINQIDVVDPSGTVARDVTGSPTDIDTEDLPFDRILALPIVRGLVDDVSITQEPRGARMRMVVTLAPSSEAAPSS